MSTGCNFINGQWQLAQGSKFEKKDPFSNETIWSGNESNTDDVILACSVARQAFKPWARLSLDSRVMIIKHFSHQLEKNKQELAITISQETGKPLWESLTEVQSMIAKVDISIQSYIERTGTSSIENNGTRSSLRHRPHGVLAVFGPYNFPGHLPNGHIVPALLAGNTIVFKPSELTPYTAQKTIELWHKAGLPQGVLNLIQGGKHTGEALANPDLIDGLLFTGSAQVGHILHKKFSTHPEKILALEMGGNNALIIHDIDDLNATVHLALQSAFISAGQRCTCARRILVKSGQVGDDFIHAFISATKRLGIGAWNDQQQPFMGTVISSHIADQLLKTQDELISLGAQPLLKMTRANPKNALLTPGILDMSHVKEIPDEEYFGPLTTIYRFQEFNEAISLANNTKYGLSIGLVSHQKELFDDLLLEAKAGIVNWNKPLTGASSAAPFGGIGASGNHRASAFYAADYCAWPMASLEENQVSLPTVLNPGIQL